MPDAGTSGYWRKLLKLDEATSQAPAAKDIWHKAFRPYLHYPVEKMMKKIFDLKCRGCENLPEDPPYIIASNHVSYLDFPAIFFCLPKRHRENMSAMYKSLYDRLPFTSFFIKTFINAFPVDMNGDFLKALATAAVILRAGRCVYISPEGTRSRDGELLPFKVGIGALAVETGVPVVPVFISGTEKALRKGSVLPKKASVSVRFGDPVSSSDFASNKTGERAYDIYKEFTEEIRERILALKAAPSE